MKMLLRWFGEREDTVSLAHIRQIPGVMGVAGTLGDIPVGQAWPPERINALKNVVNAAGLELPVIESVNVHDDIKTGGGGRDEYIENYAATIRNLGACSVKVIAYNFMPVFDWTRSQLARPLADGSFVSAYEQAVIDKIDRNHIAQSMLEMSDGYSLPGWEPERLEKLLVLFKEYEIIDEVKLLSNLKYFLDAIIPVCEKCDVKMAMHPDDPPWNIFGLPRVYRNADDIQRILNLNASDYNGLCLCSGCIGADPRNDVPAIVRRFGKRIHFAHVRNIKIECPGCFHETAHLSSEGSLDLYEIMKAYYDIGFDGYIRPDHGRMIWGEHARPGYGLYDRALGAAYINGLWEAICKQG
jgi:mannonate dehydratase